MSFNAYGQVHKGIMFADDGVASDIFVFDNAVSFTRFGFSGSEEIGNGVTAGFTLELGAITNSGFYVTIKQTADRTHPGGLRGAENHIEGASFRIADSWFSGNWGKLSLGHNGTASDGMSDADLSGSWLADFSTPSSYGGAIAHRTSGGAAGPAAFSAQTYFDGNRRGRIRYDTPSFGPLTVSVSAATNNHWAAKGYLYTSLAGGDLSMALGYEDDDHANSREQIGFSASYLFSQGTNITFNWAERDLADSSKADPNHWYIKLGHRWGNNAASISYGETDDLYNNGSEGQSIGLAFVHNIPKPKVDFGVGYHNVSYDDHSGENYEDINVFHISTRIRFD